MRPSAASAIIRFPGRADPIGRPQPHGTTRIRHIIDSVNIVVGSF